MDERQAAADLEAAREIMDRTLGLGGVAWYEDSVKALATDLAAARAEGKAEKPGAFTETAYRLALAKAERLEAEVERLTAERDETIRLLDMTGGARSLPDTARAVLELRDAAHAGAGTVCKWTEDEWGEGTWTTDCGESFCYIDEGTIENKTRFCCYCGKPLLPVPYVIPDEPNEGKPAQPTEASAKPEATR